MPVDLGVQVGGGVSNLDLDSLTLRGLSIEMGAGSTTVDPTGEWERGLSAVVRGGAGEVTVLLPSLGGREGQCRSGSLGRVNADGLRRRGEAYVNGAYADSDVTLEVDVRGGLGQIDLRVV